MFNYLSEITRLYPRLYSKQRDFILKKKIESSIIISIIIKINCKNRIGSPRS